MHYRVKSPRIEVSNIIKDVFETNNVLKDSWVELPTGLGLGVSWNILWVTQTRRNCYALMRNKIANTLFLLDMVEVED